jgi:hypothetical protein
MLHLVFALVLGWTGTAAEPKAKPSDKDANCRLAAKITFDGIDGAPLSDATGYLCERVDVPVAFDQKAFGDHIQAAFVSLKAGQNIAVAAALQQVLDQAEATYVIRDGKLVVAPKPKQRRP